MTEYDALVIGGVFTALGTIVGAVFLTVRFLIRAMQQTNQSWQDSFNKERQLQRDFEREQRQLELEAFERRLNDNLQFFHSPFENINNGLRKIVNRLDLLSHENKELETNLGELHKTDKLTLQSLEAIKREIQVLIQENSKTDSQFRADMKTLNELLQDVQRAINDALPKTGELKDNGNIPKLNED